MSDLSTPFPDLEKALVLGLPGVIQTLYGRTGLKADTSVPAEDILKPMLTTGFIRVHLLDDPDDDFTRRGLVDIDCFAGTRALAYAVAQEIRVALKVTRRMGDVTFDRVSTESGPKRVPWDSSNTTRRFLATYKISTRR